MATLSGNKVKDTYTSLLKLESNGVTSTLKTVEDGAGTDSALKLSTDTVEVDGTLSFTTAPTTDSSELTCLLVDSSNNVVKRELDATAFQSGSSNSFETISVSGQSDVVADSSTDTLTLVAGNDITITTNSGTDTVTIASTASTGTFSNPQFVLRPSAAYTFTGTLATATQAAVNNNSNTASYSINDSSNTYFQTSSSTLNAVNAQTAGLQRIDVNLIVEVTTSGDFHVDVKEKPSGGSAASIQAIKRSLNTGNREISFSLFRHCSADTDFYYELKADNSGAGGLLVTSTFSLTKLDD